MDIRIYSGGHRATMQHFMTALEDNNDYLKSEGIAYSSETGLNIGQAINAMKSGGDFQKIQDDIIKELSLGIDAKRIIWVDNKIIGTGRRPFKSLLNNRRIRGAYADLNALFKGHDFHVHVETRNPASLIPASYAEAVHTGVFKDFEEFVEEINLNEFRWSSYLHSVQGNQDPLPVSVWRFEDYAYMWRDIIGAFTGVSNFQDLVGPTQLETAGLNFKGAKLLNQYIKEYSVSDRAEVNKIKGIFQRQFPNSQNENTEMYWPSGIVEDLNGSYDDDWYYIDRMDNMQAIKLRDAAS